MELMSIVVLIVGLLVGALVGWLLAANRSASQTAHLQTELAHARRAGAEREATLRADAERLSAEFERLSARALQENSEQFLSTASRPLAEQLGRVESQLAILERHRTSAYAELRQQVQTMGAVSEALRGETAQLVSALRAPQVRGRWGELQLRQVVEAAGMVRHVDFTEQATATTADGALRPDLLVHLAGGKNVVVDAKVAFSGYLDAMQATDEATRRSRMIAHARHLRAHIDDLGAKKYWEQFSPTPEFVVLFVPAEAFLSAALEEDPTLYEHAFSRNVVLATPSTLVALLRTVAYTWRQEALAKDAAAVLDLGRALHNRLATMSGHLGKLGRSLDGATKAYNDTVASLESRVLVTARRFHDLQLTEEELPEVDPVERSVRPLSAPELVLPEDDNGETTVSISR